MGGNHYTPIMIVVVSSVWALNLLALFVLLRHQRSVLDLWLAVVACAWLFDIALSAVLNAGRYDLGFYAGRIYGLVAASLVLVVLLSETCRLYMQLIALRDSDRQKAAEELKRFESDLRTVKAFIDRRGESGVERRNLVLGP